MKAELLAKYDRWVPRYTSYPTAPHFHPGVAAGDYRSWLAALPVETPLSLYVHIPFCDSLCWFCGCHTKIVRRARPVERYVAALREEIRLIAETLDGRGSSRRGLAHLHFGGGSPTILAPERVAEVVGDIKRSFAFHPATEFAVEIDPRDADPARIAAWAAAGVTRASLGVQDLNPEVQRAINRVQSFELTARTVDALGAAGIRQINIDLMYGLPHQTVDGVLRTIDQIVTLAPARLALFGYAHVPWMKRHQRLIPEDALPGLEARCRQQEAAARRLGEAGYTRIGLDHFARPEDPLARAQAAGRLHRNFKGYTDDAAPALIGLGASAIGALPQGYVQNAVPIHDYERTLGEGRLAVVRGVRVGPDDRLRRAVIERLMCDLHVDLGALAADFGARAEDFADDLAALEPMVRDGIVEVDGPRVRLTEPGRPLVRSVCARFDSYLNSGNARHSRAV